MREHSMVRSTKWSIATQLSWTYEMALTTGTEPLALGSELLPLDEEEIVLVRQGPLQFYLAEMHRSEGRRRRAYLRALG